MSPIGSNILAGASGQATDTSYEIKKGLRIDFSNSAHLDRRPGSDGNRKTWTVSLWTKKCAEDAQATIMGATDSSGGRTAITIYGGRVYIYSAQGISAYTNV